MTGALLARRGVLLWGKPMKTNHSDGAERFALPQNEFLWGVGIEGSALPHIKVDQFEWTQHNTQWRDDLSLVSNQLGLKYLRYAIPWHYIEPEPGRFDWSIADERIAFAQELGIELLMDVMHFGTPLWLGQGVGDPAFPESLERLTEEMVRRYRHVVKMWCPVNEPLVTALFSGDLGFWPPHSRHWKGYFPVLSRVALATSRAIGAIRRSLPEGIIFLSDAADHFKTRDEALAEEVQRRNLRRFLLLDLIGGRVNAKHPLHEWVVTHGMSELDLQWFASHPQQVDAIGLDYYAHSDWQLEAGPNGIRQRRSETPVGLAGVARDYYKRFGLPMIVTETSIDGQAINREIWLDKIVADCRQVRKEGIPLMGLFWWPLVDHLDWDGALTHRVGKFHRVGLYKLVRQQDGHLARVKTPVATAFRELAMGGDEAVGELTSKPEAEKEHAAAGQPARLSSVGGSETSTLVAGAIQTVPATQKEIDHCGIVVFSHLRWGFVWQRPQQFLSRFARKHPVLFIEEPMFDLPESTQPDLQMHSVMPNVTVASLHAPAGWQFLPDLADRLALFATRAIAMAGEKGRLDDPLLWYYNPLDSIWSLGRIPCRGVVYDCMDELSQFNGANAQLTEAERRLMEHADIVFTGGQELYRKKTKLHSNVHFFGCGVEADHFGLAMDKDTAIPPDIDFMSRPILGWFGVIDERVDYNLVGEAARLRPDWSFAMIGPVVKVDPNLLPHAPNLYWMGGRDYSVLPNYCKAFDVCMMCFAINDATEFINPTKALEYLATGRPVVSTPVRDVVEQYSNLVELVKTAPDLVAAVERLLQKPNPERIRMGIERASGSTWDSAVGRMQALIAKATNGQRRSSRIMEPCRDLIKNFHCAPTQGS